MERFEGLPVLPEEATDLKVHATMCARRYNAMQRLLYDISKKMRAERVVGWIYRGLLFPLMCFIAWELWKLNAKIFGVMP